MENQSPINLSVSQQNLLWIRNWFCTEMAFKLRGGTKQLLQGSPSPGAPGGAEARGSPPSRSPHQLFASRQGAAHPLSVLRQKHPSSVAVSPLVNKVPYRLLWESHESLRRFKVQRMKELQ